MRTHQRVLKICLLSFLFSNLCCRKDDFTAPFPNLKGIVIVREVCNSDTSKDYWLIDFTSGTPIKQVGDTLVIDGFKYNNVLKTKELDTSLQIPGQKVSIFYKTISADKVITSTCDLANPVTYPLKELTILFQGRIE
jgi:hypothetical protein